MRVIAVGVAVLLASGCGAAAASGRPGARATPSNSKTAVSSFPADGGIHPILCGVALPPPLTRTGPQGALLTITKVARSASATAVAEVTVTLTARSTTTFSVLGLTPLQVLLVHQGRVVDQLGTYALGPKEPDRDWLTTGTPGRGGEGAIGYARKVGPGTPWTIRVTGPGHCHGADWAAVWRGAPGYNLGAVMSVPGLDAKPGTTAAGDPLLTSAAHRT